MKSFRNSRRVALPAEQMFDVVADIERYPQFVPLCSHLTILEQAHTNRYPQTMIAEMGVSFKAIREQFQCSVTLDKPKLQIDVAYLSGPFKTLDNQWHFEPIGQEACDVHFFISYEFQSRMLQTLMGGLFEKTFQSYSAAFEQRALDVSRSIG